MFAWLTNLFRGSPQPAKEAETPSDSSPTMTVDSLNRFLLLQEVLALVLKDEQDTKGKLEEVANFCETEGVDATEAMKRLGLCLDAPMVAGLTKAYLSSWDSLAQDRLWELWTALQLDDSDLSGDERDMVMMRYLIPFVLNAAEWWDKSEEELRENNPREVVDDCIEASTCLALHFDEGILALRIVLLGINTIARGQASAILLDLVDQAVALGRLGGSDPIADEVPEMAVLICTGLSTEDPALLLRASDLTYDMLLASAAKPSAPAVARRTLGAIRGSIGKTIAPLAGLIDWEQAGLSRPPGLEQGELLPLCVDQPTDGWFGRVRESAKLLTRFEDNRLELELKLSRSEVVEADWQTHAFRVPAYQRSIPTASGLMLEMDPGQTLLLLLHELTHVFTMASGIGTAIALLQTAISRHELALHAAFSGKLHRTPDQVRKREGNDVRLLALSDASVEMMRKIQIIRDVWRPWLEGLAVFAEVHADPDEVIGQEWSAPVFLNLLDRRSGQDTNEALESWLVELHRELQKAKEQHACDRLRFYLFRRPEHYLAGYFAVRRILRAWRHNTGEVAGADAARLLVELTQQTTNRALPRLDVPLGAFREAAVGAMTSWVDSLSEISAEDLEAYLDTDGPLIGWLYKDRPVASVLSVEELDDEMKRSVSTREPEVFAILSRNSWSTDDWASPTSECLETAAAVREAMQSDHVDGTLFNSFATQWSSFKILPIGAMDALFWLNKGQRLLFALVRQTVCRRGTDEPSYSPWVVQLPEEPFEELRARVARLHNPRLRVTRVVDLAAGTEDESRMYGAHYVALEYDSFFHVVGAGPTPLGAMVPEAVLADIKLKLKDEWVKFQGEKVGDGQRPAAYTKWWVYRTATWQLESRTVEIDAWRAHVLRVAQKVIDGGDSADHELASAALLGGGADMGRVNDKGVGILKRLAREAPHRATAVLRTMFVSGDRPIPVSEEEASELTKWFEADNNGRLDFGPVDY